MARRPLYGHGSFGVADKWPSSLPVDHGRRHADDPHHVSGPVLCQLITAVVMLMTPIIGPVLCQLITAVVMLMTPIMSVAQFSAS
ncbi:hypothetical protein ACOMHN_002604 [Nucella lapillus]